jgi:predicted acyltransferase
MVMDSLITETVPASKPVFREARRPEPGPAEKSARLVSLDAYRGFIMLAMASSGFALPRVAKSFPGHPVWEFLAGQADHVAWVGCSFWDLIQPSFLFMVGVAMPYSYLSRKARGASDRQIWFHTLYRAVVLVLLGIFLSSNWDRRTHFTFVNVLSQIGLGYAFVFLLLGRGLKVQLGALAAILVGYWLWFFLFPLPGPNFDYASVGWSQDWQGLPGWFAHWDKNTNAAAWFDSWFLPLFPPADPNKPYRFNAGGYQTLNFIPSMGTMLLGLMAGELLQSRRDGRYKFLVLVAAGAVCLGLGWLAGQLVCPLVKRIWTPSWTLFSSGWTFWLLAGFYWLIDLRGWRRWAFPLVVVGMNSIAMYCMAQLLKPWVGDTLKRHLGPGLFEGTYGPIVQSAAVLFSFWLVCLWMVRRKLFLRI